MKLNREILRLSVPSILAGITVPLVGMVDIAVAGHLGSTGTITGAGHLGSTGAITGAAFIGGISIGTMLFDLLYWNFAFLRVGTGGLTAQAYGRYLATRTPDGAPGTHYAPSVHAAPGSHNAMSVHGEPDNDNAPSVHAAQDAYNAMSVHGEPDNDNTLSVHAAQDNDNAPSVLAVPDSHNAMSVHGEPGSILQRALRIALLSGLVLIALQWVVVQLAFLVVQCSPEVQALATRYFHIRIWAAPATLSLFAFKGWFIGLQDSVRPMTADLLVNGLNILLSIALGFGLNFLPRMGLSGVALGTVIAQWSGLLFCVFAARRRYRHFFPVQSPFALEHKRLNISIFRNLIGASSADKNPQNTQNQALTHQSFFTLNRDLFLRSVGMIAVYIGFTVISARYGDLMLAVSTIIMKLLMIFSYFTDGFAYAGEALTGRFIGERNKDGVRSTVRGTFLWGIGVAAAFMLLYGLGGVPLFRLMTSDASVVDAGRAFLPWLLLMPLIGCPAFIWDGIFIGATVSRDLRNSTLLCAAGFFAAWFIGLAFGVDATPEHALHLLMAAYFVHLAIRTVYLTVRYKPGVLSLLPSK